MALLRKLVSIVNSNIGNIFLFFAIVIFFVASCFILLDPGIVPILYLLGISSFGLGLYSRTLAFRKEQSRMKEEEREAYRLRLLGEKYL